MSARPLALVTGASSGIGADLATVLAARGYDLALVARGVPKMEQLAGKLREAHGAESTIVSCDLARPGAGAEVFAKVPAADVLVNNAGFGRNGAFGDGDAATELDMIQVNVGALTHLTKLYLPGMIERKSGRVMNVASTAAFVPGPYMAVYYATKAYVLSFSQAIGIELEGTGVTVTCLCPGPTHTGFADIASMNDSLLFKLQSPMKSMDVAEAGVSAMLAGCATSIPGIPNKLSVASTVVTPRALAARITRYLQGPR